MNTLCISGFFFIFVRMCNWLILDNISLFVCGLGNVSCSANRLKRGDSGAYAKALLIQRRLQHASPRCFQIILQLVLLPLRIAYIHSSSPYGHEQTSIVFCPCSQPCLLSENQPQPLNLAFCTDQSPSITKMSNQAAWIPSKGAAIEIGHAEMPIPGPGELVIEVLYTSLHITNLYSLPAPTRPPKSSPSHPIHTANRTMQSLCTQATGSWRKGSSPSQ
jgi:hypothetical protein